MAVPGSQFRAFDTDQFHRIDQRMKKIGDELTVLNQIMSKLVYILDEITQAEEVADGSPEQGSTPAADEAEGSTGYIGRDPNNPSVY